MYKVVIIGCGKIAGYWDVPRRFDSYGHATGYLQDGRFLLAGCVDTDLCRLSSFAEKYSISVRGDHLETVLDRVDPSVVSVTSPDETHYEIVMRVLANKTAALRLIFLEKPVCLNRKQMDSLLQASEEYGVPLLVNHSRRFQPFYSNLKRRIKNQEYGELIGMYMTYYGGWIHNGVHLVDTTQYLFSQELKDLREVECVDSNALLDPTLTVRGTLGANRIPVWFHGWDGSHYQIFEFDMRFERGRLRIGNFEQQILWEGVKINAMNERVLEGEVYCPPDYSETPIQNAVSIISDYLKTEDVSVLKGYSLIDAATTMHAVWSLRRASDA